MTLDLLESARRLGRCRYVELLLFSHVGARAPAATVAGAAVALSGAARAHAFRASLLEEQLPVSVGLPNVLELTVTPDSRVDERIATLDSDDLLPALVGVLYPSMLDGYRAHLEVCSPASDPAIRRCLARLTADLDGISRELEAFRTGRFDGVEALESALQSSGGVFGRLS